MLYYWSHLEKKVSYICRDRREKTRKLGDRSQHKVNEDQTVRRSRCPRTPWKPSESPYPSVTTMLKFVLSLKYYTRQGRDKYITSTTASFQCSCFFIRAGQFFTVLVAPSRFSTMRVKGGFHQFSPPCPNGVDCRACCRDKKITSKDYNANTFFCPGGMDCGAHCGANW